jgi:hypothetical protein
LIFCKVLMKGSPPNQPWPINPLDSHLPFVSCCETSKLSVTCTRTQSHL